MTEPQGVRSIPSPAPKMKEGFIPSFIFVLVGEGNERFGLLGDMVPERRGMYEMQMFGQDIFILIYF